MSRRLFAALALLCAAPLLAAAPAPHAASAPRNDFANPAFAQPLAAGLRAFYTRDFSGARKGFESALAVVPDDAFAVAFLNAALAQSHDLDALIDAEEERVAKEPKNANAHARLGFSYLFSSSSGRNRDVDAREELNAAVALDPHSAVAHTGLGVMRENERSASRAKAEFLAALQTDPHNVLAREHLAEIYQIDLKDPQRALAEIINIPNLVPDYADIDFKIASLLEDLGQYEGATTYATRGLQTDVGRVGDAGRHGYTLLARIYLDEKKVDDARRVLKASITAGNDVALANTLLKKIDDGAYGKASPAPQPTKK